jgi:hypothetical protein
MWLTKEGRYCVGTEPPEGVTVLGVYYPRAGTLGGGSMHIAMIFRHFRWIGIGDISPALQATNLGDI